ncbi:MAG: hypothetical protein EAZ70_13205 [Runella slithyformis]|nr:MAG: hypothetical protein EAY79_13575 [Runella slithyformis]TAG22838.1 MAG: hypothetical protein EAZ38_04720 [Cytophagales bacterium]TAG40606.1 MAG: hypothetical protein EAZ32_06110 [Cytophagia bacterium]TAF23251.1 MAG: hypothetical protein EAZ70_13205 [Runella slithyformis]TAF43391.1 MAG: hypothetical protein EAZ63_13845 [Runella slithyformis]
MFVYLQHYCKQEMTRLLSVTFQFTFTAFVHLLCCWLPLLMALVNNAAFNWLNQYRIPLIIIQLVVLAWSFYDVYGRPNHAHSRAEKGTLWAIVCLTIFLNTVPHRYFQREESRLAQAQMERYASTRVAEFKFSKKIKSPQELNNTLQLVEGVVPSQIEIENQKLSVRYRSGKTSKPVILAILRQQGYAVEAL